MLEPRQCRAARALLGWSRARLATESGISSPTIDRYERGESSPLFTTVAKLRRVLERSGVIFVEPNSDHGPGVILKDGKT